jgi:ATP-dependent Clp protease ATP-binding subunit ClpA
MKSGAITVIGITSPKHYCKVQTLPFSSELMPIIVPAVDALDCFSALRGKHDASVVEDGALALCALFSYHKVGKTFSIQGAEVILSDVLYRSKGQGLLTKELFLNHWKELYSQDPTKISLASLNPDSRGFFSEKGVDVDECISMVAELNKVKKNEHLGHKDMPRFLFDMNEAAREGKYEGCIGREEEIKSVVRRVQQPKNKSLVMLGHPGIGKTAIYEEIALRIVNKDKSVEALWNKVFYWVDVNSLVGTNGIVGQLEKAVGAMIDFCNQREGEAVLVVDELHQFRGAGVYKGNDNDVFEMIKNPLSRDEIVILGSANDYKWNPISKADPAIERRIKPIHLQPPTPATCVKMLNHVNRNNAYTKNYQTPYVDVTAEAIRAAVYLTETWMKDRYLPDKATVLISEAVSYYQDEEEQTRGLAFTEKKPITSVEIIETLYHSIKHNLKISKAAFMEKASKQLSSIKEEEQKEEVI